MSNESEEENEDCRCKSCGDKYILRFECEPTDHCDLCAQTILPKALEERDKAQQQVTELCEELSVVVTDTLDPENNVAWMRGSPKLPQYVQGLEAEVKRLREALEKVYARYLTSSRVGSGSFQKFAEEMVPVIGEALNTTE